MAAALLRAKGQKKNAEREARRQVAVWTTIGLDRLGWNVSVNASANVGERSLGGEHSTC